MIQPPNGSTPMDAESAEPMNLSQEQANKNSGNSKAASNTGEESSKDKAGKRGRPRRIPSVQSNTMSRYITKNTDIVETVPVKRNRAERGYDSSDEEMDCMENKKGKASTSPNKDEMSTYAKLAKVLHKMGRLDPILAEAATKEYDRLMEVMKKEGRYYSDTRARILKGKKGPTEDEYSLDCAVFELTKSQMLDRIDKITRLRKDPLKDLHKDPYRDLMTKAVDYVSPDTSVDTSTDTSLETSKDTTSGSSVDTSSDDSDASVNSVVSAVMKGAGMS